MTEFWKLLRFLPRLSDELDTLAWFHPTVARFLNTVTLATGSREVDSGAASDAD